MKDNFKIILVAVAVFMVSGCASLVGNIGPVHIECTTADGANFTLNLPQGSGRVTTAPIELPEGHPCGPMTIPPVTQGEDRSTGILGVFRDFIGL